MTLGKVDEGEEKDQCKPDSPHIMVEVFSMRCVTKQKINLRDSTHLLKCIQPLEYVGITEQTPGKAPCHSLTIECCSSGHFPVPNIKIRPCFSFCLLRTCRKRLPTWLEAEPLQSHWPSWKKAVLLPNRDAVVLSPGIWCFPSASEISFK